MVWLCHQISQCNIMRQPTRTLRPMPPRTPTSTSTSLALDPRSVEARTLLANLLVLRVLRGQTDTAGADTARADELVEQALAVSPNNASAQHAKGNILRIRGRCPEA